MKTAHRIIHWTCFGTVTRGGMTCQVNLQVSENFHREKCGDEVAAVVLGVLAPPHGFSRIYFDAFMIGHHHFFCAPPGLKD